MEVTDSWLSSPLASPSVRLLLADAWRMQVAACRALGMRENHQLMIHFAPDTTHHT